MTEYATAAEIAGYLGTRNWVVARKTVKIIERYGDVICLSPTQFKKITAHSILLGRVPM
jgi:hypothetical protein